MSLSRLLVVPALLATSLLAACSDDAADPDLFPGRVPCASDASWDGGAPTHRTFVYDADKHLLSSRSVDPDGTVSATVTNTWVDGHLATSERQTATTHTRTTYTYVDDLLRTIDRADLVLDNGDSGYTLTITYRGDVQVAQRLVWHDPARGSTMTTITGDDTARSTWRECPEGADAGPCTVSVWEQPDRDPTHWTRGTIDAGEDGTIDDEFTQTYDRNFLPLVFEWRTLIDTQLTLDQRETSTREADGTELRRTLEVLTAPAATLVETFAFTCAAARTPAASFGGPAADRPEPSLARFRRNPTQL
ncbi:MAG: hypothetical protein JNK64_12085 [Myxococcales bacterium]|nr:hypothetical protein [Myxococcales bacterium]